MLIFVHIEKTAGTSLKFIFRNTFGKYHCDSRKNKKEIFTQNDLNKAKKIFGKIKAISGHNLVEPTKNLTEPNLYLLTFLREPLNRSASYYQDHCQRGNYDISFDKWMEDENKHNMQTKKIAGEADPDKAYELLRNKYFFTGLSEKFDESLKLLAFLFPEKLNLKYKKKLIAPDNSIKNKLLNDPQSLKILKDANKADIKLYNYVKNELYPQTIKKYQNEIDKISLPNDFYKTHNTWNYQISMAFNKYFYKQLLKIKKDVHN